MKSVVKNKRPLSESTITIRISEMVQSAITAWRSSRVYKSMTRYHYGLLAIIIVWGSYFTWFWLNVFRYNLRGDIVTGYPIVWADWAAHLTYASVFAFRDPSDWFMSHPLFAGTKFSYPFLPDALSGLLMRTGIDVIPAFIIPSILATFALLYVLYRFTYHFTGRVLSAILVMCLFFFSGGFGFLFVGQVDTPYEWFTYLPSYGVNFINFIVGEIIPQRSFLFGLSIALVIILILERIVARTANKYLIVIGGLLAGTLTIIHPHSLIVIVIVSAIYALCYRHRYRQFLLYATISAIIIGIYWLVFLNHSGTGHIPHWQPGWMTSDYNFVIFELLNFGLLLPLGIYSAWKQKWIKHPLFISGVVLFIICNLFSLQVWEWDNTKIFTYAYLFLLLPIAIQIVAWIGNHSTYVKRFIAILCIIALGASGTADVIRMSHFDEHTNILISAQELQSVADFRNKIPSGSIMITGPRSNQPYTMFGNAQTLMGYDGWLHSYGIDYTATKQAVTKILAGSNDAQQLLKDYHVSYIIVDNDMRANYVVNDSFLSQFPIVLSSADTTVYDVR